MRRTSKRATGTLACAATILATIGAAAQDERKPSAIDNAMYFQSAVHDAADCQLQIDDQGRFSFANGAPSRAADCPDATAWKVLFEGIQSEFWNNWTFDAYAFPEKPLPLCGTDGADPNACCDPVAAINPGYDGDNPALHCPFYRGDHPAVSGDAMSPPGSFQGGHGNPVGQVGPGRTIRQLTAEIVYRNKPMFQYLFENSLYSQNGLARAFAKAQDSATRLAPYRLVGSSVEFPTDAVVFKVDWLHQDHMLDLGLIQLTDGNGNQLNPPQNSDAPYVTMMINQSAGDNNAETFKPGLHYLLGFAIATKDLPDWFWASFEHVALPGRCDFNGCNDSFGYENAEAPDGTYKNFIPPHAVSDDLFGGFEIFERAQTYPDGVLTPALPAIYEKLGFDKVEDQDPSTPSSDDSAWKSYRLKGIQTQFTTAEGFPTIMGNVISEGGFVNTSSCMTCHTQASVDSEGKMGLTGAGFSVRLNRLGYRESATGVPELSMFYSPGTATLRVLRTDYMWGTLFASPEISPDEVEKAPGGQ
jgi:hypothetical protein